MNKEEITSNWKTQKSGYEKYWDKFNKTFNDLYGANLISTDWEASWRNICHTEMKDESVYYTTSEINGEVKNYNDGDFDPWINDRIDYLMKKLENLVTPSTDYIIELGSGWGRNIIPTCMHFPNTKTLCGEITEAGRSVTQKFIDNYNLNIETFEFNWCEPTSFINFLKHKAPKEIVIFSFHSIEQVTYMEIDNILKIIDLPIKMKWFHIEPCAFQLKVPSNNSGWNQNYIPLLKELETTGKIKINELNPKGYKSTIHGGTSLEAIDIQWNKI